MNTSNKPHVDVRDKVLTATLRQLDALGCTYHVFVPWTGDEHGFPLAPTVVEPVHAIVTPVAPPLVARPAPTPPAEPPKKKRTMDMARGLARNRHILPYLLQLRVGGDPVNIPVGEFQMDDIQGTVGSRLARAFGEDGCYVTSRNHENKTLQALVTKNLNSPKLGEAEAIVKTYSGGQLGAYAEECLDAHRKTRLAASVQQLAAKHKSA